MRRFKFEVGIYNKTVRELMQKGERHRQLKDEWADMHWIEILGEDEKDVRARINARYPPESGFVVTEILRLD